MAPACSCATSKGRIGGCAAFESRPPPPPRPFPRRLAPPRESSKGLLLLRLQQPRHATTRASAHRAAPDAYSGRDGRRRVTTPHGMRAMRGSATRAGLCAQIWRHPGQPVKHTCSARPGTLPWTRSQCRYKPQGRRQLRATPGKRCQAAIYLYTQAVWKESVRIMFRCTTRSLLANCGRCPPKDFEK